jgi:hypothetical protein
LRGYNYFSHWIIRKKLCYPKRFFLVVQAATSTPRKLPKERIFFFL